MVEGEKVKRVMRGLKGGRELMLNRETSGAGKEAGKGRFPETSAGGGSR